MSENNRIAEVVPAVMPKNRAELLALADVVKPFAKTVQLDIVDGVFDDDLTWPYTAPGIAEDFSDLTLPYSDLIFWEVDLMVKEPKELSLKLIRAGARRVTAHIEAFRNIDEARDAFESWHSAGAQAGVSLLLDTPISAIEELFYDVEVIQIMGIAEIGAQGHPFDPRAVVRVRELRNNFSQAVITVDGGVNVIHAQELIAAGANRVVVGSAIMKVSDPKAAYDEIVAAVSSI